jgi:uncharacterized protein YdbL (DUF1318 family)
MSAINRLLLITALWLPAALAHAIDLDTAKARGLVGERADGYLGAVVEPVATDVAKLVREVNDKRRGEYERIAAKNRISVKEVEALAGKKTLDKTPKGLWIFRSDWERK